MERGGRGNEEERRKVQFIERDGICKREDYGDEAKRAMENGIVG